MPVVTTVGVSVNTHLGEEARLRMESAMHKARDAAYAEGLSPEADADAIRDRMMAAHAQARAEYLAEHPVEGAPAVQEEPSLESRVMSRIDGLEALIKKLLERDL